MTDAVDPYATPADPYATPDPYANPAPAVTPAPVPPAADNDDFIKHAQEIYTKAKNDPQFSGRPASTIRQIAAGNILMTIKDSQANAQVLAESLQAVKTSNVALTDPDFGQTLWLAASIAEKMAKDPDLAAKMATTEGARTYVAGLLNTTNQGDIDKAYAAWKQQQAPAAPGASPPAATAPAPAPEPHLVTPPHPAPAPAPAPPATSELDDNKIEQLFNDTLDLVNKREDLSADLEKRFPGDTATQDMWRRGTTAGEVVTELAKHMKPEELADRLNKLKMSDAAFDNPDLGGMLFTASNLAAALKVNPKADIGALVTSDDLVKTSEQDWATEYTKHTGKPAPGAPAPSAGTPAPADKTQEVVWDPTPGTHDCMVLTYNPADKTVDVGLYQNGGPVSFRLTDKDKGITSLTGQITDVADAQAFDRIKAAAHGLGTGIFGSMVDRIPVQEKSAFDNVMNVFKAQASGTAPAPAPSATPDNTPDNSPATPAPAPNSVNPAAATPPAATPPAAAPLPPRVVHGYGKIKVNGADQDVSFVSNPQTGTSYSYTPNGQAKRDDWSESDMVRLTGDQNIDQKIGTTQSLNKEELNRLAGYSAHLPDHGSMQPPVQVSYDPYQGRYPGPRAGPESPTYRGQNGQALAYNQMTQSQQISYWMSMNRTNG